jgi:hypothetical protein
MKLPWTNSVCLPATQVDRLLASKALCSMRFENATFRLVPIIFDAFCLATTSSGNTDGRIGNGCIIVEIFISSNRSSAKEMRSRNTCCRRKLTLWTLTYVMIWMPVCETKSIRVSLILLSCPQKASLPHSARLASMRQ